MKIDWKSLALAFCAAIGLVLGFIAYLFLLVNFPLYVLAAILGAGFGGLVYLFYRAIKGDL